MLITIDHLTIFDSNIFAPIIFHQRRFKLFKTARADRHLVVSKEARGGIATSDVQTIHGEDRVGEIARMLGDGEGEAARRHAQALLRKEKAARR
jgi:hypothetical protein